jgi:hypothetical protein
MAGQTEWPALQARVSNRLSRYFCTTPFKLRNPRAMVSFTFDDFPDSAATSASRFSIGTMPRRRSMSRAARSANGQTAGKG